ncbi:MAG: phosphatase domain-containing protein [Chryseolinea sp.]
MSSRIPTLLSYYALSNKNEAIIFGQVTNMRVGDLSFLDFNRRRTFHTLLSLYRTKAVANETVSLTFDSHVVEGKTDASGFFFIKDKIASAEGVLQKMQLGTGELVHLVTDLYSHAFHHVDTPYIVVSDIDDTILHSYISRKILKFRTLMFTTMEKRRAVEPVKKLIRTIVDRGATPLYISNSEQNLYPLIYRFLTHNKFPVGPLFLKQMRKLKDIIRYRKVPTPEVHKLKMLDEVIPLFSNKKFILIGDNTQFDMAIYLTTAKKYPDNITDIFIRKVINVPDEVNKVKELKETLAKSKINFYYAEEFTGLSIHSEPLG